MPETELIRTLKKPWADSGMNFHCQSNDRIPDLVLGHPPRPPRNPCDLCAKPFSFVSLPRRRLCNPAPERACLDRTPEHLLAHGERAAVGHGEPEAHEEAIVA